MKKNQQGFSIIAAVFIIVILAFMGVMLVTILGSGTSASVNELQSVRALSIAEGGLEFALMNGVFPNYAYPATPLGSGSFAIASQYIGQGGIAPATVTDNPLSAGATAINVTSTANYLIPGAIRIESEYILCTGTTGNQFNGCTRGWAGSVASAHNAGTAVTQCVVTSTGTVGNAQRTVRAWVGGNAGGGIAVGNSSVRVERNSSLLNWNHNTGAGADRFLIVGVSLYNDTGQTVTGVTYDTVPLVQIGAINNGNSVRVELWRLVAPSAGNNPVRVALSGNTQAVAGAVSFTGVDQTTPIDAGPAFNTGNNAAPTVTIATLTDNAFAIDALGVLLAALADVTANVGPGQVSQWNDRTSGGPPATQHVRGAGSAEGSVTPPGNVMMSWTLSAARTWAIGAVALRPSPSGVAVVGWQEVVN